MKYKSTITADIRIESRDEGRIEIIPVLILKILTYKNGNWISAREIELQESIDLDLDELMIEKDEAIKEIQSPSPPKESLTYSEDADPDDIPF